MLKKLFAIITALIFCISTYAANNLQKPIFNSPKNPIILQHNQKTFTITLPANPSTGFSWTLAKYDQRIMNPVAHKYFAPNNKKLMGAPGYVVWTFRVKKMDNLAVNQMFHVTMQYARPRTKYERTDSNFIIIVKAK
ncbi:MAG TPA: protease inhibitor I42 family protein [Coxiellaceae bacterium]|nr:MAG: hypothetical protein A3E81_05610 [Gammaproteobacteria bacterium RIFCSPHIGHO2_12_FULL_36_30]HLB56979.1 protease inhibitor I42 family protein [Coxiellaceae bacterium]